MVLAAGTPEKRWIINGQCLKIYNGGQLERLTSIVYLNDPGNEEQRLAKDDKLSVYWEAT